MYNKLLVLLLIFCIKGTYAQYTPSLITVDTAVTKSIKSKSFFVKNPVNRVIQVTNIRTLTQQFTCSTAPFNINPFDSVLVTMNFYTNQNITYRDFIIFENYGLNSPLVYYIVATAKYPDALYSFTQGLIDEPLKTALRTFTTTGYITLGYNTARDHMYGTIDHYESPDTLECVYTGRRAYVKTRAQATAQGFNCEHTYPQGFFNSADPMVSDLFHLYPTDDAANNARGNYPFGLPIANITFNVGGSKLGKDYQGETVFEPRNVHKGNVARSLFYFSVKYSANYGGFMTAKQEGILRQWNVLDTVNANERLRNTRIKSFQNVFNPFIDHPELVDRIKSTYSVIPAITKPEISASPNNVIFDTLAVNDTASYYVAVMNYGTGNLAINSVTSNLPQFIVESFPTNISQNELRYIKVKFKPTEINQTYIGALTIQNPDSNITVNILGFSNMHTEITSISTLLPEELTLMQNFPNPFNPTTKIRFAVPSKLSGSFVILKIYDLTGREIANPISMNMKAGYYEMEFDGSSLASGIYLYRLQSGNYAEQRKFTLIK